MFSDLGDTLYTTALEAAEAERDRLAKDNERLQKALDEIKAMAIDGVGVDTPNQDKMFRLIRVKAQAALRGEG
jgi:hypothetical protein